MDLENPSYGMKKVVRLPVDEADERLREALMTEGFGVLTEIDVKASEYRFGLGMGLHFDHFDVDATLDPEALFTGGYFLSG